MKLLYLLLIFSRVLSYNLEIISMEFLDKLPFMYWHILQKIKCLKDTVADKDSNVEAINNYLLDAIKYEV